MNWCFLCTAWIAVILANLLYSSGTKDNIDDSGGCSDRNTVSLSDKNICFLLFNDVSAFILGDCISTVTTPPPSLVGKTKTSSFSSLVESSPVRASGDTERMCLSYFSCKIISNWWRESKYLLQASFPKKDHSPVQIVYGIKYRD